MYTPLHISEIQADHSFPDIISSQNKNCRYSRFYRYKIMNNIEDLYIFATIKKSIFWGSGPVEGFTPPDPNDLSISRQFF